MGRKHVPTFKSGIDLVRVSAIVRDQKGRFVEDLSARDFEVIDGGIVRTISDFRRDGAAISVALLFDVSGSMESTLPDAREAGDAPSELAGPGRRGSGLHVRHAGSRRSRRLRPVFGSCPARCRRSCLSARRRCTTRLPGRPNASAHVKAVAARSSCSPTGATMRAVSHPARCPASPVRSTCRSICSRPFRRSTTREPSSRQAPPLRRSTGPLSDLATKTGGHVFVASTPATRSAAARQIVDELRHQYLIAFESSGTPGWHPLVVRARNKDLVVRARSGYLAGQSRPSSD